jgi:hypothetical protein
MTVRGLVLGSEHEALAYNLSVEGIHTYFVGIGNSSALVHNTCGDDIEGIEHAMSRHTWSGSELDDNAGVFDNGIDFDALAKGSVGQIGRVGKYGNIEYTVRAPGPIGVTGRTKANPAGVPTNMYTIVRDPYDGALVTMFPGMP